MRLDIFLQGSVHVMDHDDAIFGVDETIHGYLEAMQEGKDLFRKSACPLGATEGN